MPNHDKHLYGVILAGGSGTRLWPLSRRLYPKHLLSFNEQESLLQITARRILSRISPQQVTTITHLDHLHEVHQQLQAVHQDLTKQIFAEPEARNTLPAIAWATGFLHQKDPEALIMVFPSDHLIQGEEALHSSLSKAVSIARDGYLVTLGIRPTGPATGYGYICAGQALNGTEAFRIQSFTEKPDSETAHSFIKNGHYYWNAGIFAFAAKTFQEELKSIHPEIYEMMQKWIHKRELSYGSLPHLSIDYGIMEKTKKGAIIPADISWSDLGSWEAVYEHSNKDTSDNLIQGNVVVSDCHDSLFVSREGCLAAIGLSGMAVVQTEGATFISPLNRTSEVKKIVEQMVKGQNKNLTEGYSTITRPWGSFTVLVERENFKVKKIVVRPGQKLSLQQHRHRAEHWVVIEGTARVINGDKELLLETNESTYISKGNKHRLENPGATPLVIIEVQTGTYVGEDDIERFEDLYGRI
ncbi:MAG: mannose-1-phosphate guanylyltransferase/mannose-6-phosphate isomerase [Deltaproteobacteria bacterium]|nr:mannose-1-phosphate guanylyltransferase/mannose-6-phosphate isomerase [Deltaproteobacteria bacterium]